MSLEQSAPSLLQRWKYFSTHSLTHAAALSIPLVLPFPPSLVPPAAPVQDWLAGKMGMQPQPKWPQVQSRSSTLTLHTPLPYLTLPLHCTSIFLFLTHLNCLTSLQTPSSPALSCPTVSRVTDETKSPPAEFQCTCCLAVHLQPPFATETSPSFSEPLNLEFSPHYPPRMSATGLHRRITGAMYSSRYQYQTHSTREPIAEPSLR